jgi:hypothetical protein
MKIAILGLLLDGWTQSCFASTLQARVDGIYINALLHKPRSALLDLLAPVLIRWILMTKQSGQLSHVLGLRPVGQRLM